MSKQNFEATEGLLQDVMTKQSGAVEKALLEAVMNSVDANASSVQVMIEEDTLTINDDGDSMSQEEVERYFKQFGLKDTDVADKEFGKFRMGRGQIFNFGVNIWRTRDSYLIVNIHGEEATVELPDCTQTDSPAIENVEGDTYTLDTSGLSYVMLDAEPDLVGLNVQVNLHNTPLDVEETESDLHDLVEFIPWVHDTELVVNGSEVVAEPEVVRETDLAWYAETDGQFYTNSDVYNKGARVDSFNLGPTALSIITKRDLDVTLDRTDILETDEYWQNIQSEYEDIVVDMLVDSDDVKTSEANWLVRRAGSDLGVAQRVADQPLLEDVDGDMWTLNSLAGMEISHASATDTAAQKANGEQGVVVLQNEHQDSVTEFAEGVNELLDKDAIKEYVEMIEESLSFEMSDVDEHEMSKRRRKNLRRIRQALNELGYNGNIEVGYSNHRDTWQDDESTVFVDKDYLNCTKKETATQVLMSVVRECAHDGDSRAEFNEDFTMMRSLNRLLSGGRISAHSNYPGVQRSLLAGKYD